MSELVRITGRVQALTGTIEAPLSGRPCVAFETLAEERTGAAPRRIARETGVLPFVIGDVAVDPAGARLLLSAAAYERCGVLHSPTAREAALLARHGEPPAGPYFNRPLEFREAVLAIGAVATVVGRPVGAATPFRGRPALAVVEIVSPPAEAAGTPAPASPARSGRRGS